MSKPIEKGVPYYPITLMDIDTNGQMNDSQQSQNVDLTKSTIQPSSQVVCNSSIHSRDKIIDTLLKHEPSMKKLLDSEGKFPKEDCSAIKDNVIDTNCLFKNTFRKLLVQLKTEGYLYSSSTQRLRLASIYKDHVAQYEEEYEPCSYGRLFRSSREILGKDLEAKLTLQERQSFEKLTKLVSQIYLSVSDRKQREKFIDYVVQEVVDELPTYDEIRGFEVLIYERDLIFR